MIVDLENSNKDIAFSVEGQIVMKNQTHQLPKRLKLVFSNGVADEMGFKKFTYIHECDNDLSSNIFDGNKFKIQMKNIPLAFDNVIYNSKYSLPRQGTSLKDNYILEGRIVGIYEQTTDCTFLKEKVLRQWPIGHSRGPLNEVAVADRHIIFYRRGSLKNVMTKDQDGVRDYLTLLKNYANDSGCDGCHGWKWFGCLHDWQSQIPEGFSCAKAVASNKEGCKEIYEQVDCSDLVVKVASERCSTLYETDQCPLAYMVNETVKNENCMQKYDDNWNPLPTWVKKSNKLEHYTCCRNSTDCCQDCISKVYLGT